MKKYHCSCVDSTADAIIAMQDMAEDIDRSEFVKEVDPDDLVELERQLGYDEDFPISEDWHVTYHRSVYRSNPCVYLRHSAIEYIFL